MEEAKIGGTWLDHPVHLHSAKGSLGSLLGYSGQSIR